MTTDPINAARDERTVKPPPLVSLTLCGTQTSTPTTLPSRPPANPICQLFHAARPKPQTGHSLGCCHQENAVRPKTALPYPATPPVLCPRPVRPRRCAALVAGPPPYAEPDLFARTKSVHLVVSAAMMMMILNSGTTTWEYYPPLKMTTPKYRVRQVAHDDDVEGSSMGGP